MILHQPWRIDHEESADNPGDCGTDRRGNLHAPCQAHGDRRDAHPQPGPGGFVVGRRRHRLDAECAALLHRQVR